ncbi:hypothetical protein N7535_001950 [Penicillium sp. DV-2018c]|nr:hypothetical protein N7461_004806 [Penicillium sp. DV-2018c]KAJ5583330.1 hypothetical protein N7535_001950 [Penicillium sp. DV-2018c]
MPEPERGGKHKRACDSCASLKKACNGDVPCVECIQRDKLCTYQRLLGDEPSLQAISQTSSDAQNIENLVVGDDHDADARKAVGSSWDLGPATLYPSSKEVFARRQNTLLGSTRGSAINWVPSSAGRSATITPGLLVVQDIAVGGGLQWTPSDSPSRCEGHTDTWMAGL